MSTAPKPAAQFKVIYFASAHSYTSKEAETLQAPLLLSELFDKLEERYAGMKSKVLESCLVTVNLEYVDVDSDFVIKEGDEVAIIPPVSSG